MTESGATRVEQSQKRLRTYLGGELVADTTAPLLVWESRSYPDLLHPPGGREHGPAVGFRQGGGVVGSGGGPSLDGQDGSGGGTRGCPAVPAGAGPRAP